MEKKRRQFLLFGTLLGLSPYIYAEELSKFDKIFEKVKLTIYAVQTHMFPTLNKIPSAEQMQVIQFLFETITHKSYDKDIRAFVIEGAQELIQRENGKFVHMTEKEKEQSLREYEKTNYGSTWLSRIMTITMEGMFSDPIYGANINKAGWKALNSYGGEPRPQRRYLDV